VVKFGFIGEYYEIKKIGGDSGEIIEKTEELNEEFYKCLFGIWDHIKKKVTTVPKTMHSPKGLYDTETPTTHINY